METVQDQPYVAYYRVSTKKQGRSGLGLEAQRQVILDHLKYGGRKLIAEYTDIESGTHSDRPNLAQALKLCRLTSAKLVVAKLDRLARNVAFVSRLMETKIDFEAVDFPQANRFTVQILAAVAEYEAKLISERVRAALAAAKAKGVKLGGCHCPRGNPAGLAKGRQSRMAKRIARDSDLAGIIEEIRAMGFVSNRLIARELNARRIHAPFGGKWFGANLRPVLKRLAVGMTVLESRIARGVARRAWKLQLAPIVEEIYQSGHTSAGAIAAELNARGIAGYRGRPWKRWTVRPILMQMPSTEWRPLYAVRADWMEQLRPVIAQLRTSGFKTQTAIAHELNARGYRALLGGQWCPRQVRKLLLRLSGVTIADEGRCSRGKRAARRPC